MDDLERLSEEYVAAYSALEEKIKALASKLWQYAPLTEQQAEKMLINEIMPRIEAGQVAIGQITVEYMRACAREMNIPEPTSGVDYAKIEEGIRGVPPVEVYRRPAVSAYKALKQGKEYDLAKQYGQLRLMSLIGGDLQLAKRQTAHQCLTDMREHGVQYYRRILTGKENCALCVVASTQRYRIQRKLMPIHPGCDCGQGPLPPGPQDLVLDPELLEQAHAAVESYGLEPDRSARTPDYRKLIIKEIEHGEYGPIMELSDYAKQKKSKAK